MWLIVGLGNPGTKYEFTRHNIGFMCVDVFVRSLELHKFSSEQKAQVLKANLKGESLLFVKPQSYMNNSGESVKALMTYYKIDLDHLLVIHDDIDQPFGSIKFQKARGHGGHNGIRSMIDQLGTNDFARLKLGVGRPPIPQMDVADYVLQNFSVEEQNQLSDLLNKACDGIETCIFEGLGKASTIYNKNGS